MFGQDDHFQVGNPAGMSAESNRVSSRSLLVRDSHHLCPGDRRGGDHRGHDAEEDLGLWSGRPCCIDGMSAEFWGSLCHKSDIALARGPPIPYLEAV